VGHDVLTPIDGGFRITPHDWEYYPAGAKNRGLQDLQHIVSLTVSQSGVAKVDVQHQVYTYPDQYSVATISNEVMVLPANGDM
jgi:hypothetical protein